MAKINVGDKFTTKKSGEITVLAVEGCNKICVIFSDGNTKVCTSSHVRLGKVKNNFQPSVHGVGFIGNGGFSTRSSSGLSAEYSAWSSMIARCYCPKYLARQPTYAGCSVSSSWLNFQNFAAWYTAQPAYGKGFDLDKDLTTVGNKVYSPEACYLVPRVLNALLVDRGSVRGEYPQGVHFDSPNKKFVSRISLSGTYKRIGSFDTPELAFSAYKAIKEAHVKEVAMKFRNEISEAIYNNLMNYAISITD